jgi:hypothetical protein
LANSSFPSLKTPTILSQQELGNPVGKAFASEARVSCSATTTSLLVSQIDQHKVATPVNKGFVFTSPVVTIGGTDPYNNMASEQ